MLLERAVPLEFAAPLEFAVELHERVEPLGLPPVVESEAVPLVPAELPVLVAPALLLHVGPVERVEFVPVAVVSEPALFELPVPLLFLLPPAAVPRHSRREPLVLVERPPQAVFAQPGLPAIVVVPLLVYQRATPMVVVVRRQGSLGVQRRPAAVERYPVSRFGQAEERETQAVHPVLRQRPESVA